MKWPNLVTIWLVIATVVVWIVWDPVAFVIGGSEGESTESVTIGTWLDKSIWLTFAIFLLVFHLVASGTGNFGWKHVASAISGGALGYLLTRYS